MHYPHLSGANEFPAVTGSATAAPVDVFKFDNRFDYSRYDYDQMELCICSVPWDMGEAHIGNRTISGIGNVVYFDDEAARDAYFDGLDDSRCIRFTTKYKELHYSNEIVIPVPFNVASLYNYIEVKYVPFANPDSLVEYESESGINHWFWFIRECEFVSPNTTRLKLLPDAWQTFIYSLHFSDMILERGHAPLSAIDAKAYLKDPINNCNMLLEPDVSAEDVPEIVKYSNDDVFNGPDSKCVIVTTGDVFADWGTRAGGDWMCPGYDYFQVQGVPSYYAFAIDTSDVAGFFSTAWSTYPQFFQTVKCLFFITERLLEYQGSAFEFMGVTCRKVSGGYVTDDLITLETSQFGYAPEYASLAKLYTSPYAHIELTDQNGNINIVRIEDVSGGKLEFKACANLVYPWIRLNGHVSGVGRAAARDIRFKAISEQEFPASGNWYRMLIDWEIPTLGVRLSALKEIDYSTYYEREQALLENATAKTNTDAQANTLTANAALQAAANTAITSTSNDAAQSDTDSTQSLNIALQAWNAGYTNDTTNNQIDAQYASAAVGAAGAAANGVASALAGGGPGALVGGVISGISTLAQGAIAANLSSAQAAAANSNSYNVMAETNQNSEDRVTIQIGAAEDNADTTNDYNEGVAANNAATMKANASRTKSTADAGVAAIVNQGALRAPFEFGNESAGDTVATRPLALSCNIVTQDDFAISKAGDAFLRYGYMYNRRWHFAGDWRVMPKFTYWKLSDFWLKDLNVPDAYVDRIRFFLFGGVTVWRDPADIGNTTIYDNI